MFPPIEEIFSPESQEASIVPEIECAENVEKTNPLSIVIKTSHMVLCNSSDQKKPNEKDDLSALHPEDPCQQIGENETDTSPCPQPSSNDLALKLKEAVDDWDTATALVVIQGYLGYFY